MAGAPRSDGCLTNLAQLVARHLPVLIDIEQVEDGLDGLLRVSGEEEVRSELLLRDGLVTVAVEHIEERVCDVVDALNLLVRER